jgi:ferric-dicitrate binding protein FerR (iron transport regulator)
MKEKIENKDWLLIAKHLGNELDDTQKKQLSLWLAESEENRKELSNAEKIWELSNTTDSDIFDTTMGWNKLENRIRQDQSGQQIDRKRIFMQPMRIAASLLVLVGLGILIYWFMGTSKYIKVTAEAQKILSPLVLPDGSKVYLNTGTTIKYPKSFTNSATRNVELSGEAFFEVSHNANQPFIIQTSHARVKVLGTSFDVAAYQSSDSVKVVVETGTVELSRRNNHESIRLTKGNSGVYYANQHKLIKSDNSDVNALAWKTNVIIFHNANLDYVSKTLERLFDTTIRFENESLKKCHVDVNFIQGEDLESILKTIKETLHLNVTKMDNIYTISGTQCKT